MKIDPPDSPNAPGDEAGADDLEALRDLVRVTRSRGPSEAAARRITERLVSAGALGPASLAKPSRAGANAPTRIAQRIGYYKVGAVALAVAAGSLLVWRATWTSENAPVATLTAAPTSSEVVSTEPPAMGPSARSRPTARTGALPRSPRFRLRRCPRPRRRCALPQQWD